MFLYRTVISSEFSGDFSGMSEKVVAHEMCLLVQNSLSSLFSLVTACICLLSDITDVCNSWFDFCSFTMLLWANSRLLQMSITSL